MINIFDFLRIAKPLERNLGWVCFFLLAGDIAKIFGFDPAKVIEHLLPGKGVLVGKAVALIGQHLSCYGLGLTTLSFVAMSILCALYYADEFIFLALANVMIRLWRRDLQEWKSWQSMEPPQHLLILARAWILGLWLVTGGFLLVLLFKPFEVPQEILRLNMTVALMLLAFGMAFGVAVARDSIKRFTIAWMSMFGMVIPIIVWLIKDWLPEDLRHIILICVCSIWLLIVAGVIGRFNVLRRLLKGKPLSE